VLNIRIGNRDGFLAGERFAPDVEIYVEYYSREQGGAASGPEMQQTNVPPVQQNYAPPGYVPPQQSYAPQGYAPVPPQGFTTPGGGAPMARIPGASMGYLGRYWQEVEAELRMAGFTNVMCDARQKEHKGLLGKEGGVSSITVNGQTFFGKGDWFPANVPVLITYSTYADSGWN